MIPPTLLACTPVISLGLGVTLPMRGSQDVPLASCLTSLLPRCWDTGWLASSFSPAHLGQCHVHCC